MTRTFILIIMAAVQFGCSRASDNEPHAGGVPKIRLAFVPFGKAKVVISPEGSAYPGKKWLEDTVTVRNIDQRPIYVFGHNGLPQVYTKDAAKNEWVSCGLGYCGTGAEHQLVKPGESFTVEISLPWELWEREYRVEVDVGATPNSNPESILSQSLRMRLAKGG